MVWIKCPYIFNNVGSLWRAELRSCVIFFQQIVRSLPVTLQDALGN